MRPGRLDTLAAEDLSVATENHGAASTDTPAWTPLELSALQSFIHGLNCRMQGHVSSDGSLIIGDLLKGKATASGRRFHNFDFSWTAAIATTSTAITATSQMATSQPSVANNVTSTLPTSPAEASSSSDSHLLLATVPPTASPLATAGANSNQSLASTAAAAATIRRSPYIANHLLNAEHVCDPFDAEHNMRVMDKLYNATFREFIRNEDNVMVVARHLISLIGKHDIKVIANGLRWVMDGWYLENVAKLLKLISRELLPDVCGLLVNLITLGWEVTEDEPEAGLENDVTSKRGGRWSRVRYTQRSRDLFQSFLRGSTDWMLPSFASLADRTDLSLKNPRNAILKLCAIMTAGEPAESTAIFIKSLTMYDNWGADRVTELVSFLDAVLEWDEVYFKEFTEKYIDLVNEAVELLEDTSSSGVNIAGSTVAELSNGIVLTENGHRQTGKISFDYLAALYKTNLALANYKIALADFKAAAAARQRNLGHLRYQQSDDSSVTADAIIADQQQSAQQRPNVTSVEDLYRQRRRRSVNSIHSAISDVQYSRRASTRSSNSSQPNRGHDEDEEDPFRLLGLLSSEPLLTQSGQLHSSAPYRHPPSYLSPTYRMRVDSAAEAEQLAEREMELSNNGDRLLLIEDAEEEEEEFNYGEQGRYSANSNSGSVDRIIRRQQYDNPFSVISIATDNNQQPLHRPENDDIVLAVTANGVISRMRRMSNNNANNTPIAPSSDDGFWNDALDLVIANENEQDQ